MVADAWAQGRIGRLPTLLTCLAQTLSGWPARSRSQMAARSTWLVLTVRWPLARRWAVTRAGLSSTSCQSAGSTPVAVSGRWSWPTASMPTPQQADRTLGADRLDPSGKLSHASLVHRKRKQPPSMRSSPSRITRWSGTQVALPAIVRASPLASWLAAGVAGWARLPTMPSSAPAMPAADPIRRWADPHRRRPCGGPECLRHEVAGAAWPPPAAPTAHRLLPSAYQSHRQHQRL
jgi:hypothetical protein